MEYKINDREMKMSLPHLSLVRMTNMMWHDDPLLTVSTLWSHWGTRFYFFVLVWFFGFFLLTEGEHFQNQNISNLLSFIWLYQMKNGAMIAEL